MKTMYQTVFPYQADAMNLPVKNLEQALPFYQRVMGFQIMSRQEAPVRSAVLGRDSIRIGLAENGEDSTQDGCFFEVSDVEMAFAELKANGLAQVEAEYRVDRYGDTSYRVFFVVAPDELCYCLGEREV